ncbi:hypothetical protein F4553_001275 [Allocatelliglobosispora scoriae]|uniref:Uncharacterized protein n=1 Tax=Allocatelliglobosispora scoriae TaxID=643052 RepID=A0A841BKX8_9ACTN|nr:hypothetical protein [Allocatelliglobosispora scoriae]MBB5867896.1 hypothetical protein [Allocatelliglobosispora scoriae]
MSDQSLDDRRSGPCGPADLRELASTGGLARRAACVLGEERMSLVREAYEVVWPVVFQRITRRVEAGRGHHTCAISVRHLADGCLDGFHDDVEAVVEHVLTHATMPIRDLEAWVASRLTVATVDAHRRRRGQRGALQRPRLPKWLAQALGNDPWPRELATQILVWAGVTATAGTAVWPVDRWAQRRAEVTGDTVGADPALVRREIETVLRVMQGRPAWYAKYVEEPMGRKPIVAGMLLGDEGLGNRPVPASVRDDRRERAYTGLAAIAVDQIAARLHRGDDVAVITAVTVEVLGLVFGSDIGAVDLDQPPHGSTAEGEAVAGLLADPAAVERIVAAVRAIIEPGNRL